MHAHVCAAADVDTFAIEACDAKDDDRDATKTWQREKSKFRLEEQRHCGDERKYANEHWTPIKRHEPRDCSNAEKNRRNHDAPIREHVDLHETEVGYRKVFTTHTALNEANAA
ncbi:MAG: hypothetical protein Aurels2KO_55140 [Aureliella sp.]